MIQSRTGDQTENPVSEHLTTDDGGSEDEDAEQRSYASLVD